MRCFLVTQNLDFLQSIVENRDIRHYITSSAFITWSLNMLAKFRPCFISFWGISITLLYVHYYCCRCTFPKPSIPTYLRKIKALNPNESKHWMNLLHPDELELACLFIITSPPIQIFLLISFSFSSFFPTPFSVFGNFSYFLQLIACCYPALN